jgi:2-hydroxy-3-keto-5-methylthiopentenyl-1-phosphate phosphatase
MGHSLKVFCDFDGTVAVDDVGEKFFQTFGGETIPAIIEDLYAGKITPRECYTKEFEALRGLTVASCDEFFGKQTIDPYFRDFSEYCREKNIDLWIVSDGFDFYIKRIMDRYGLADIPFLANHLAVSDSIDRTTGELEVEPQFPYTDSECVCCANCKRNHVINLSGEDDIIVYIGDGISDRCPARYADIVFAKGRLIRYCQEENISYVEFKTFRDVLDGVKKLLSRKRLKKRREAEMRRRDVFMQG